MLYRVLECGLDFWAVNARLEPRSVLLNALYQARNHLKLLNEAICGPCAQWPAPEHHLVPLIEQGKILAVRSNNPVNILILKGSNRCEIFQRAVFILYAKLALNVKTAREN